MTTTDKLIARLFNDNFGRLNDEKQADLKSLYQYEDLFSTQDEWLDALDIYLDDAVDAAHYTQLFV
jgi:hypothetical protein